LKNATFSKFESRTFSETEAEMLKTKNFGRKSLNDIKEILGTNGTQSRHDIAEQGNAVPGPTSNQYASVGIRRRDDLVKTGSKVSGSSPCGGVCT